MYYTTSGSKRQNDYRLYQHCAYSCGYSNIYYCAVLRSKSGILFPIEFLLGTIVNALTSVKHFINGNKVSGLIVAVVAVLLAVMTVVTALIVL